MRAADERPSRPRATVSSTIRCTRSICFSLMIGPSAHLVRRRDCRRAGGPPARRAPRGTPRRSTRARGAGSPRGRSAPGAGTSPTRPPTTRPRCRRPRARSAGCCRRARARPASARGPRPRRPGGPSCVDPVNEIIRTFGSSTSACPTSGPPQRTCRTPDGQPGLLEDPRDDHAAGHGRVRVALEHDRVARARAPGRASASPARSGSSRA